MSFNRQAFLYRYQALFSLLVHADIPFKGGVRLVAEAPEFFADRVQAAATPEYAMLLQGCQTQRVVLFLVPNLQTLLCGQALEPELEEALSGPLKGVGQHFPPVSPSPAAYNREDIRAAKPGIIWLT